MRLGRAIAFLALSGAVQSLFLESAIWAYEEEGSVQDLSGEQQPGQFEQLVLESSRTPGASLAKLFIRDPHALVTVMRVGTHEERRNALEVTRQARDPRLAGALAEIARTNSEIDLRVQAIVLIGWTRGSDQIDVVCQLTSEPDSLIRAAAFHAIGLLANGHCIADVISGISDSNELASLEAAIAAVRLGRREGERLILKASRGDNQLLRLYAIEALADLGTPEAKDRLLQVVEGSGESWKAYAELGLEQMRLRALPLQPKLEELSVLVISGRRLVSEWAVEELLEEDTLRAEATLDELRNREPARAARLAYLMDVRGVRQ